MKIDFYHIDAFEVANYAPIWRALREKGVDAHLVAVPGDQNTAAGGWFDFSTFQTYCEEQKFSFVTRSNPDAVLGITTQNADILKNYSYKVRLMYGPVIFPSAWALQKHAVQPFDAVLTHGQAYVDRYAGWLSQDKLHIIGYPRYDDFFSGKLNREKIRARWGITDSRPVLIFLPTWGENTAFEKFFPFLSRLAAKYNVLVRPHHCTLRFEQQRMMMMQASGITILKNAFDLEEVYAGADVVLADVRSGGLFEACLCQVPVVGAVVHPSEITGWLAQNDVDKMAALCSDPFQLEKAIETAVSSLSQAEQRQRWAERHVAFRDGSAARRAAEVIISIAEQRVVPKNGNRFVALEGVSVRDTNLANN